MPLKLLHKGDENRRRFTIMDVSRSRDKRYVPQLLVRLNSRDETIENKRHIVRALGNIGDPRAKADLLQLFSHTFDGNILGDLARSLGKMEAKEAIPKLEELLAHSNEWVRVSATCALKQLCGK